MRGLFSLTFGVLVAVLFVFYVIALVTAFLLSSFGRFLVWLTTEGLPVTIGAAVVGLAVAGWYSRKRRTEVR